MGSPNRQCFCAPPNDCYQGNCFVSSTRGPFFGAQAHVGKGVAAATPQHSAAAVGQQQGKQLDLDALTLGCSALLPCPFLQLPQCPSPPTPTMGCKIPGSCECWDLKSACSAVTGECILPACPAVIDPLEPVSCVGPNPSCTCTTSCNTSTGLCN